MKKLFICLFFIIGVMCSIIYSGCDKKNELNIPNDSVLLKYECVESDSAVSESARSNMEEKLKCKVLRDGKLRIIHSNVVFDKGNDVKLNVKIINDSIIVNEIAPYGISSNYSFYTLTFVIGGISDGEYDLFIKRNGNSRAMFKINYDSSKAVE